MLHTASNNSSDLSTWLGHLTPHTHCSNQERFDNLPTRHRARSTPSGQQLWRSHSGRGRLTERAFRHLHRGLVCTVGQFVQANTTMLVKGPEFPGAPKSSGLLDTQPKCLPVGSWVCLGAFLRDCGRVSVRLCARTRQRAS